jgi:thioredoxin-like negative regulator of GroEL
MNEEAKELLKTPVMVTAAVAVVLSVFFGIKGCNTMMDNNASALLSKQGNVAELEDALSRVGSRKQASLLKLRLAKAYYDHDRYQEAYATYCEIDPNAVDGYAEVVTLGKAHALEAMGSKENLAEAKEIFKSFADANTKSPLKLAAQIGQARCVALEGDKAGAIAILEGLKKNAESDDAAKASIESAIDFIERHEIRSILSSNATDVKSTDDAIAPETK